MIAKPVGAIRLITANLFHERAEPDALAALLDALAVDIACLQELGARQASAIARVLPHGKLEPGASVRDHDGMGIAARRPIGNQRLALPCRDARIARLAPADWPELAAPLELLNLHIQAPHSFPQWRAFARRRAQLAALLPYLDASPRAPRVVCGDFNATPLWPAYRVLAARLADLASECAARRGARPARTWGPWSGSPRLLRIDHALGSGVLAAAAHVVPLRGSDHSALVVDLLEE
ncbi:MAG TPA: endonuclease/exonuclease/phosphatase family protein [Myxococcota bacterium]|nr:endonuclease/exonuclease/phosphatase family protein [Myxococcota bacterium]